MTADLNAVLQSGETIVFRTSGRSYRRQWSQFGSAIAGLMLYLTLSQGFNPEYDLPLAERFWYLSAVIALIACPWALALLIQARKQRLSPDEVIITDRRLLYSKGDSSRKFDSVTLDRIQGVSRTLELDSSGITVESEDQILRLPRFGAEPELADRLTEAAGLEPLTEIGPLVDVDLRLLGYAIACLAGYLPLWFLVAKAGHQIADERLFNFLSSTIPMIGGIFIGLALGVLIANLLTVSVMRQFATPEQMQAALVSSGGKPWQVRPSLLWSDLLYRRPLIDKNG